MPAAQVIVGSRLKERVGHLTWIGGIERSMRGKCDVRLRKTENNEFYIKQGSTAEVSGALIVFDEDVLIDGSIHWKKSSFVKLDVEFDKNAGVYSVNPVFTSQEMIWDGVKNGFYEPGTNRRILPVGVEGRITMNETPRENIIHWDDFSDSRMRMLKCNNDYILFGTRVNENNKIYVMQKDTFLGLENDEYITAQHYYEVLDVGYKLFGMTLDDNGNLITLSRDENAPGSYDEVWYKLNIHLGISNTIMDTLPMQYGYQGDNLIDIDVSDQNLKWLRHNYNRDVPAINNVYIHRGMTSHITNQMALNANEHAYWFASGEFGWAISPGADWSGIETDGSTLMSVVNSRRDDSISPARQTPTIIVFNKHSGRHLTSFPLSGQDDDEGCWQWTLVDGKVLALANNRTTLNFYDSEPEYTWFRLPFPYNTSFRMYDNGVVNKYE